jgi:hypothetical protein
MTESPLGYEQETDAWIRSQKKKYLTLALSLLGLLIFIAWEGILLKSYAAQNTRPPAWDQSVHMEIALDYWRALRGNRWDWGTVFTLPPKAGMPPFPPLYHLALTQVYRSSNPAAAALGVNFAYFALLCIAIFGCAYFFRPDYTALLAAIAFCASPMIWGFMTTQLVDLPVAAMATAALWAFLISEGFTYWTGSLLFGALFGLGMMHKWSFFSYFIPAYLSAFSALQFRSKRWKVLTAALTSLLIFGPWYAYHLPILVPRLLEASSDMGVPIWNGGIVAYLFGALDGLGPFLWAVGFTGILTAQYRRHRDLGWVIVATVITSYVFWTLVPNRQIRFLLPGLSGLAIAAVSAWPNLVLWLLAVFQVFTAANLSAGWISPVSIPLPFHSISLFPSGRPSNENWHIEDILRMAESKADPSRPIADLVLVANAPFFNDANFTWMDKYLELKKVHMRTVHKRLCELSEFLVLKTGTLGPPGIIQGLARGRDAVLDPHGWFEKAYEQVGLWELPDRSKAILFQQKRLTSPPFRGRKIHFQFYSTDGFTANDLTLLLGAWDNTSASYPFADVRAADADIQGLRVKNLHIQIKDLSLVPALDESQRFRGDVRILKMSELKLLSAEVSAGDLTEFLKMRFPELTIENVSMERDLKIQALWRRVPIFAEASLDFLGTPNTQDFYLSFAVRSLHAGPIALPAFFLKKWGRLKIGLYPNPETPFNIVIPSLAFSNGQLTIP